MLELGNTFKDMIMENIPNLKERCNFLSMERLKVNS